MTRFDRRSLLRGLAATALLAPFAQLPKRARAAAPKRAMFVYVPDGCIPALWHPKGSETSFTLPEMSAPLEPIKQHLVFLEGLTMYSGGATHEGGIAKVLTGVSPQSLDIFLGDKISADRPHRSLQLGVGTTFQNGSGSFSYIGEGQTVNPDDDPLNAFSRVFGTVAGTGGDDTARALAKRQRQSVLDASLADLNALKARLGSTEKEKLDVHLDSLRELENRISGNAMTSASCDISKFNKTGFSVSPTDYYPKTYHKEENFKLMGQMQMDLAALALSCGSTNVVSLMWSHAVSPTHILETGVTTGNHDASHYGSADSQMAKDFVKLKRWFMEQFVYLIQKLASTPDDGGTLLDNTLVLLCSELGDSNLHDHDSVPFVLAGKAGGALRTGRYLSYKGKNAGENEPHSKLLVSVANALDVPIDSFGFTGKGKGPLSGLL
jgi:Protein of unknown function (DUF1552)